MQNKISRKMSRRCKSITERSRNLLATAKPFTGRHQNRHAWLRPIIFILVRGFLLKRVDGRHSGQECASVPVWVTFNVETPFRW